MEANAGAIPTFVSSGIKVDWNKTPLFDWFFIIFGGLPVVLPLVFFMGESKLAGSLFWYNWVNACVSAPHVYATYCRLHEKINAGKVSWTIGFPAYATGVGLLGLASLKGFYLEVLTAVNVWQSWHYVRQVYGVSRIYGRSAEEPPALKNLSFYSYHLAMPLFVLGRWNTLYTAWGGRSSSAIIPVHFPAPIMMLCWILAGIGVITGVTGEAINFKRRNAYNPAGISTLIVSFAVHAFGFLSVQFFQRGFFAVTLFHAIQYLGLVWVRDGKHLPGGKSFPVFWLLLFVGSYVLQDRIMPAGNYLWPSLAAILLAGVSAHHYFVDMFIWRSQAGA